MVKIKIIDLLSLIANGKSIPLKIRYSSYIFKYTGDKRVQRLYIMENFEHYLLRDFVVSLNSEVEILEVEKDSEVEILEAEKDNEIEKLDITQMLQKKKWKRDKKSWEKINEIIDEVNKLRAKDE